MFEEGLKCYRCAAVCLIPAELIELEIGYLKNINRRVDPFGMKNSCHSNEENELLCIFIIRLLFVMVDII
jgi:hypothetical protein